MVFLILVASGELVIMSLLLAFTIVMGILVYSIDFLIELCD